MSEQFLYYIACIFAVILMVWVVKKITGCLVKIVITLLVIGLLAYGYFMMT